MTVIGCRRRNLAVRRDALNSIILNQRCDFVRWKLDCEHIEVIVDVERVTTMFSNVTQDARCGRAVGLRYDPNELLSTVRVYALLYLRPKIGSDPGIRRSQ